MCALPNRLVTLTSGSEVDAITNPHSISHSGTVEFSHSILNSYYVRWFSPCRLVRYDSYLHRTMCVEMRVWLCGCSLHLENRPKVRRCRKGMLLYEKTVVDLSYFFFWLVVFLGNSLTQGKKSLPPM